MTTATTETPVTEQKFVRGLGLLDSTMLVAGSMIGSGIFIVSSIIARQVGSPGWLLVVRRIGGDDAKGRRSVRLSSRSFFAALGISLRLDAFSCYSDRDDRRGRG